MRFRVPEIIPATIAIHGPPRVMVQTLATGTSLDNAVKDTKLKRVLVEALARQWVKVLLFGSRFYHADLHPGNYMVDVSNGILVNLLDYGMAGTLSVSQRNYMLLFGIAIQFRRADLIADSLWHVSNVHGNRISQNEFTDKLTAYMAKNPDAKAFELISFATKEGLIMHSDFVNMDRGTQFIDATLLEYGSKLQVADIILQESLKRPLFLSLLMSRVGNMSWWEIIKHSSKEAAKFTKNYAGRACRALVGK